MAPTSRASYRALLLAAALAPTSARLASFLRQHLLAGGEASCASLKNQGTHFTVEIEVGTPPQKFDVVADTGSDSVIVSSCRCMEAGRCNKEDKCFRGINHSTTFTLAGVVDHGKALALTADSTVPELVITFGSGKIETVVASDVVRVGATEATMDKSLLLMVDQQLDLVGPFEGILGLGLPKSDQKMQELLKEGESAGALKHSEQVEAVMDSRGFLQHAGVPRFSICFNSRGEDGVLRLGPPKPAVQLGSVGTVHWGLGFRGVTVVPAAQGVAAVSVSSSAGSGQGEQQVEAQGVRASFCDLKDMAVGQATPCGAIPDSGTTLIMGPADHLAEVFSLVCDAWPKCASSADGEGLPALMAKIKRFQRLLMECESWKGDDEMSQLPTLLFHLAGADGTEMALSLPPQGYIMQYTTKEVRKVKKHLAGIFDVVSEEPTGKELKVCAPAFGTMDYNTQHNGPVWIFGTPFFYDYQVVYDLETSPPAVSFLEDACGSCNGGKPAFLSHTRETHKARSKGPWMLKGEPRTSPLDTSLPL